MILGFGPRSFVGFWQVVFLVIGVTCGFFSAITFILLFVEFGISVWFWSTIFSLILLGASFMAFAFLAYLTLNKEKIIKKLIG